MQEPIGNSAAAAKVMRFSQPAALKMLDQEAKILQELHNRQPAGTLAVPRVLGRLQCQRGGQHTRGLLLQPVGVVLNHKTLQLLQGPGLAGAIQGVVGALKASHDHNTVHSDVRPDNMLITAGTLVQGVLQRRLILSDWCVASAPAAVSLTSWGCRRIAAKMQLCSAVVSWRITHVPLACSAFRIPRRGCSRCCNTTLLPSQYCGTTKFASDKVLLALSLGASIAVSPEDDLESLVSVSFLYRPAQ